MKPRARIVVVGGGIGGLSAAIDLASRGHQVTLFDRAAILGGKIRTERVGDRFVDAGPTVVTMRWVFEELFARAGVALTDKVTLTPAAVLARHAWSDGSRLDLFADEARTRDAIAAFTSARDADGYLAFRAYTRAIYETVEGPFLRAQRPTVGSLMKMITLLGPSALARIDAHRTMARAIASFMRDPRLQQLFGRYATYCGSSPFMSPATLNVIAEVEARGVYLVGGGVRALAVALEEVARELGVEIACGVEVKEILVQRGKVVGVDTSRGIASEAHAVVVNADAAAIADARFGAAVARAVARTKTSTRSLSAVTWAITGRTNDFPLHRHNVFFSNDSAREFADLFDRQRLPEDPTIYVCAQDRSDADAPAAEGADERFLIIMNAPATADDATRAGEAETERCEEAMLTTLARSGCRIAQSDCVRRTPRDFAAMYPSTGGALYGANAHAAMATLTRPAATTNVRGLFLAGGSAHPGAGVPMAALSGMRAAESAATYLASIGPFATADTRGSISTA